MKREKKETKAINCSEAVARLNDFLDNYLKGKERDELVTHISACRHCFERFEFEQLLKSKVHQLSKSSTDEALVSRIEKMIELL